jgi:DNA protecting protein DprA
MSEHIRTVVALSRLPGVGRVCLRAVLERMTADASTDLSVLEVVDRFREQLPNLSLSDLDAAVAQADEILERCQALGVTVHPLGWPSYPSQLGRLAEPPALLFSIGRFEFQRKPRIAVIGTRKPTPWGLKTAKACAAQVAESHGVVVSGLALGIDRAAQAASVEHHGPTWAVLAHGLHTVSPASNRALANKIVEHGGALISEYAPGEPAQPHYFVERDRIQAGLSDAVLVIESGIDGGAMHTVRFAQQARVPVWVTFPNTKLQNADVNRNDLPEPQHGTWELLRAKTAALVTTAKALDEMMRDLANVPDAFGSHDSVGPPGASVGRQEEV